MHFFQQDTFWIIISLNCDQTVPMNAHIRNENTWMLPPTVPSVPVAVPLDSTCLILQSVQFMVITAYIPHNYTIDSKIKFYSVFQENIMSVIYWTQTWQATMYMEFSKIMLQFQQHSARNGRQKIECLFKSPFQHNLFHFRVMLIFFICKLIHTRGTPTDSQ